MFKNILDEYKSMMNYDNAPPIKGAGFRMMLLAVFIFLIGFISAVIYLKYT